jgi:hypothetical protein
MKLMIDTDTAKKITSKYEKFQAVISLLSFVPLTVACELRLRRARDAKCWRLTRSTVADPFSNATSLRQRCDGLAI